MKEIKLYSPIEVTAFEDDNTYPTPINGVPYAEKIDETIKLMDVAAGDRGLMAFFDKTRTPEIDEKVKSIHYSLLKTDTELYCVTTIEINDGVSLDKSEMNRISDYVTGQYSDGIGEVLEQTPIITEDSEIYVHLWQDSNWNLMSQTVFDELTHFKETIHKPDAPMIGADGNYSEVIKIPIQSINHKCNRNIRE